MFYFQHMPAILYLLLLSESFRVYDVVNESVCMHQPGFVRSDTDDI